MQIDSVDTSAGTVICARAFENRRLDVLALLQMAVDVLDGDRRIVDENTDREREAAERHEIDRLAERVEQDDRGEDRQRNRDGDDQRAAPASEEQQHHECGQRGGDQPSVTTPLTAARTNTDWSPVGGDRCALRAAARARGAGASLIELTMLSVEAEPVF